MDVKLIEKEIEDQQTAMEEKEEHLLKKVGLNPIPYSTKLSFQPLINHIREKANKEDFAESYLAKIILKRLEKAPELMEPIDEGDMSVINEHKELLQILMLAIFPPALRETQLSKVTAPFSMKPLYITPAMQWLWNSNKVDYVVKKSSNLLYCSTVVRACSLILNRFYGQNISVDTPISLTTQKEGSPLERHFKTQMDTQFVDIKALKPLKHSTR